MLTAVRIPVRTLRQRFEIKHRSSRNFILLLVWIQRLLLKIVRPIREELILLRKMSFDSPDSASLESYMLTDQRSVAGLLRIRKCHDEHVRSFCSTKGKYEPSKSMFYDRPSTPYW